MGRLETALQQASAQPAEERDAVNASPPGCPSGDAGPPRRAEAVRLMPLTDAPGNH